MGEGGSLRPLCGGKGGKKRCVSKIEREITVVSLNHFSCILLGERGNRHAFHAVHLLLLFSLAIRQFHNVSCILITLSPSLSDISLIIIMPIYVTSVFPGFQASEFIYITLLSHHWITLDYIGCNTERQWIFRKTC